MGLIGGILTPLASGVPVTFMSPTTFLRRPLSWLRMVSRYRATVTGGPNFAFDLCMRRVTDADLDGLDLSSVELTFTGAEPVRLDTIKRFVKRFEPYGFRAESFFPCYGLAEATLYVTGGKVLDGWRSVSVARDALELEGTARPAAPDEPARKLVSCGSPGPDTTMLIVDPARHEPLDAGGVGEIWITSPSVADGYWRRPDDSADTFGAMTTTGEGPFLRTGDLGFVLDDELFVAGRMKDLIVLNGRNYHPIDIEQVCEAAVTGIRRNGGAAFAVEDDEGSVERLVVVYETDPGTSEEQHRIAIEGIRRTVSMELSVPPHTIVLVAPRTTPKTSSGKVQRWLCRRQYLAGELKEIARWQAPTRSAMASASVHQSE
jgi:acyl-CoA synthetase (AMP-forming)/AMP-acid ligase II